MISRSEALNIPDIQASQIQQERIAALGITIAQFQKTLQGRALIERQEPFILAGMIYQGYNQKAVECPEDQLSESEIDAAHDIDGSKQRVLDTRRRRFEANKQAKDKESAVRRQGKIAQERDELELILLKRQIAALPDDEPEATKDPEPETATITPTFFACPKCSKAFPTKRGMLAHQRFNEPCKP